MRPLARSALAALVGVLLGYRPGGLAARVARREERARVLDLLNRRPDCGRGMMLTWRLWRRQAAVAAECANGADPKIKRRPLTYR